jgi:hypothetical protein
MLLTLSKPVTTRRSMLPLTEIAFGRMTVRHLPCRLGGAPPTGRKCGELAVADLLVVVLRVLPGKIREWLNAGRNLARSEKDAWSDSGEEVRSAGDR